VAPRRAWSWPRPRRAPEPGGLLAQHYRLLEELGDSPQGWQFLAEELRQQCRVSLLALSREFARALALGPVVLGGLGGYAWHPAPVQAAPSGPHRPGGVGPKRRVGHAGFDLTPGRPEPHSFARGNARRNDARPGGGNDASPRAAVLPAPSAREAWLQTPAPAAGHVLAAAVWPQGNQESRPDKRRH
jgi:hypothetical protein